MHTLTIDDIFSIQSVEQFNDIALRIFHYQAENNEVYKEYLYHLGTNLSEVDTPYKIPFLPIEFFKTHKVITGTKEPVKTFFSSGTTGMERSNHYLTDLQYMNKVFCVDLNNNMEK